MLRKAFLITISFLTPLAADARIYKCVLNGETTFSERPCEGTVSQITVKEGYKPNGTGDSERLQRLTDEYREEWEQTKKRRAKAQKKRDQALFKKQKKDTAVNKALKQKNVVPGMTPDQVVRSWGRPTRINRSNYNGNIQEQWIFSKPGRTSYVYVKDGEVTSVQY